ncbi:hypothetical protein LX36DRAFT_72341 [Colletotrichum falcatum]|nr:hypothetical protein LX36DRAFT_72341 [Colletotrichum falcatum]
MDHLLTRKNQPSHHTRQRGNTSLSLSLSLSSQPAGCGRRSTTSPLCHCTKREKKGGDISRPSVTGSRSINHHQHQRSNFFFFFFTFSTWSIFDTTEGDSGGRGAWGVGTLKQANLLFFFSFAAEDFTAKAPPNLKKLMCIQGINISAPHSGLPDDGLGIVSLALHFTFFHIFTTY